MQRKTILEPIRLRAPYDADLVHRVGEAGSACTVVGKHCESGDVLIRETRCRARAPATYWRPP